MNAQVRINGIVQIKPSPPFRPVRVGPEDDHAVLVRSQKYFAIGEAWGTFPSPFQVGIGGAEPFWAKTTAAANSNVTATHEDNHLLGKDSLQSARRRTGAGQDFVEISGIIAGLN